MDEKEHLTEEDLEDIKAAKEALADGEECESFESVCDRLGI